MSNQNLFFYGVFSKLVQFAGVIVMCSAAFVLAIHWILAFIVFVIGIIILLKGMAMRFDFQRSSGSIIHRGDW